ncbi:lectin-like [Epinephelus lanceolatus]|uniref:lectin-like n=1 Tax=Epinephelus lanceolatus TaxID=310571 RepID=UPI001447452C|nr:lectin-like [Epinephelus lanceolatus]
MHNSVEYSQVLCLAFRANTHKDHFWIGGRSKYLWHSFQWTDNTPFHFARWGFMQLDMVSGEECVEMNYKQWGLWNNAVCSGRKYYVCARRS